MAIAITKLDAARRQLKEAIRLWFQDGDPVAIHCLACSAHEIIHDLNQKKKGRDLLYDSVVIKDEYQKDWARRLKAPYNFFKHADKDADDVLEFDPRLTQAFILFSIMGLQILGQKGDEISRAFVFWIFLHQPDLLTEKGRKFIDQIPKELQQTMKDIAKLDFFRVFTTLLKDHFTA